MTSDLLGELRERKISLMNKIEVDSNTQKIKKIGEMIDKHVEFEKTITGLVQNQAERQQEEFKRRITERRERSVSRSMNKTNDHFRSQIRLSKDPKEIPIPAKEDNIDILKHQWVQRRVSNLNMLGSMNSGGSKNVFKDAD